MTPYDTVENLKTEISDNRPTREEAEAAVEVLLRWAGDDPKERACLIHQRVLCALMKNFSLAIKKTHLCI